LRANEPYFQALVGFTLALAVGYFGRPQQPVPNRAPLAVAGTPALALGLADGRRVLRREVAGVRVMGEPQPAGLDDRWILGPAAESLTATLAAVAVEQGRIRWTSRADEVLPGVDPSFPAGGVTLEQLLAHQTGLGSLDPPAHPPPFGGDLRQQRLLAARWLLAQSPVGARGTYSRGDYLVAAAMLEQAFGEPWEQALDRRLLAPLGLQARLQLPGQGDGQQPWGHFGGPGQWIAEAPGPAPAPLERIQAPAGALVGMRLGDVLAWAQVHLRGLQGQACPVLSADGFRKLHLPVGSDGLALGWIEDTYRGRKLSCQGGSGGSFTACVALDPDRDRALVLLANGEAPRGASSEALAAVARDVLQ
jgi:CubicO group peptidase (beta-lactamase class C family)